jgi:hypothetical protein
MEVLAIWMRVSISLILKLFPWMERTIFSICLGFAWARFFLPEADPTFVGSDLALDIFTGSQELGDNESVPACGR